MSSSILLTEQKMYDRSFLRET